MSHKRIRTPGPLLRPSLLILAGLGLASFGRCSTLKLASAWAARPVAADGASGEWLFSSGSTYRDEHVQVSASNDSTELNLMVRFRSNDEKWARACGMTGLTVYLDPSGKKNRNIGLRFAAGPSGDGAAPAAGMQGRTEERAKGGPPRRELDGSLVFIDRKMDTTRILPADGTSGLSARFKNDAGVCTYELVLPMPAADSGRLGIGAKPGGTVMVGLTAGTSKEEREAMRARRPEGGGPPGGGMGGGRPGGPPGGRGSGPGGGPGGGSRPATPENPELWLLVKLAQADENGGTAE